MIQNSTFHFCFVPNKETSGASGNKPLLISIDATEEEIAKSVVATEHLTNDDVKAQLCASLREVADLDICDAARLLLRLCPTASDIVVLKSGPQVGFIYQSGGQWRTKDIDANAKSFYLSIADQNRYPKASVLKKLQSNMRDFAEYNRALGENIVNTARVLLQSDPSATNIIAYNPRVATEPNQAAFIAKFILAIFLMPLLVIMGMRGKGFFRIPFKEFSGEKYKKFVNWYTYVGIVLYIVGLSMVFLPVFISSLGEVLTPTPGLYVLFVGGIIYYILGREIAKRICKKDKPAVEKKENTKS